MHLTVVFFVENKTTEAVGNFQSSSHSQVTPQTTAGKPGVLLQSRNFPLEQEKALTCEQENVMMSCASHHTEHRLCWVWIDP